MAMTYAQNYGNEKYLSELLRYHMMKHAVSSPGFISKYLFIQNWQNLQYLPSVHVKEKPNLLITIREQLMLISAFFGFSKSKLGIIFNVSRQSIYNWFNNAEVAGEHYDKIKRLAAVAFEIDPKPSQQIFHIYANDVMEGYNKSLFDYLCDNDFDYDTVVKLSKTVYEMSRERWKRIDVMSKAQYSQNDLLML